MQENKNNLQDDSNDLTKEDLAALNAGEVSETSKLEDTDNDGEELNVGKDNAGADLDIPGSELDDANEEIGEEDEENNYYSSSDNND